MIDSIASSNNLINMISLSYPSYSSSIQETDKSAAPPPPPPPQGAMTAPAQDPLGVFSTVDADSDDSISIAEFNTLAEGIQEVTGNALNSTFEDFDLDGDSRLNRHELRSVLDEAGFASPPPPPGQVVAAYESQSGEASTNQIENELMLPELISYLESWTKNLNEVV